MQEIAISRRTVLAGAASAAVLPVLGSSSLANMPRAAIAGIARSQGKPRYLHTATALPDGRVLMAGGYHVEEAIRFRTPILPSASVEIYDPAGDTWIEASPMNTPRARHAAVLLPDGRVAVLGGFLTGELSDVEIYDPGYDEWTRAQSLRRPMCDHEASACGSRIVLSGGRLGTAAETHVISAAQRRLIP